MTLPLAITSRTSFGSNLTRMYSMVLPPLGCPMLTRSDRDRNADECGREPRPGLRSAHGPTGRSGALCVETGGVTRAALSGARASNAVRVSARPRPNQPLDRVSEADPQDAGVCISRGRPLP